MSILSTKHFYIEHLGCAKNQVDAEVMTAALTQAGWVETESAEAASVVLINSCSFIEPARRETVETVFSFSKLYPDAYLVMTGCFSQRYGKELLDQIPELSGVFGNRIPSRIVEVAEAVRSGQRVALFPDGGVSPYLERKKRYSLSGSAYVKTSEGCNHGCAFCAIPLIRGGLRSRDASEVVCEIQQLVADGVKEINLVAQDLAAYGMDRGGRSFPDLLRQICEISGDFWVRLLYIHPDNFDPGILEVCREDSRILPYFDMPFQHASPSVLKRMNRRGSAEGYLDLISKIREALPDAVIRTSLMVGFPGENKKDFAILKDFQQKAQIDWAGVFSYSREEGTAGWHMRSTLGDRLAAKTIRKRKAELETLQQPISEARMDRFVGREFDFLVEEKIQGEDLYLARGMMQAPDVDGLTVLHGDSYSPGDIVRARVVKRNGIDLEAAPF